jgi:hypothetical protein
LELPGFQCYAVHFDYVESNTILYDKELWTPLTVNRKGGKMKKGTAKSKTREIASHQIQSAGTSGLEAAQAKQAGAKFGWHFGRVSSIGSFAVAGGRAVTIVWDQGGVSSQQGDISDEQWEVFKLAFLSNGRIAILSDEDGEGWMYDYRFLEAVR